MLTVAQLAPLKDRDPYLYETLVKIVSSLNATSQRAGVDPSTPAPAPSPIASVSVQASGLVRYLHHRSVRRAARSLLFCGVGHHPGVCRAPRLFHGRFEKYVRPARQSDALLARVFPVHRLAAVRAGFLRLAADRRSRRRSDRPRASAFQRKRRLSQRRPPRRQWLRHPSRLAHRPPINPVTDRRSRIARGFANQL